jgi:hypothetical protein
MKWDNMWRSLRAEAAFGSLCSKKYFFAERVHAGAHRPQGDFAPYMVWMQKQQHKHHIFGYPDDRRKIVICATITREFSFAFNVILDTGNDALTCSHLASLCDFNRHIQSQSDEHNGKSGTACTENGNSSKPLNDLSYSLMDSKTLLVRHERRL